MKKFLSSLICIAAMLCALTSHIGAETRDFVLPPGATPAPDWVLTRYDVHDVGDYHMPGRFRDIFYDLSVFFVDLVCSEAYHNWFEARMRTEDGDITEEFWNEAVVVAFIRDFNISREDFERANEELRQSLLERGHVPNGQFTHTELFPADLIFTFDNELINAYFLWENSKHAHLVGLPLPEVCLIELWGEAETPEFLVTTSNVTEPPETEPETTPAETDAPTTDVPVTEPPATEPPVDGDSGVSTGVVIGLVALVGAIVAVVLVLLILQKKKRKSK